MRGRIVAQALLTIALAGCGGAVNQEYSSPEGRFRVQFPGKPKLKEQTVPTQVGPIVLKIASTADWSRTERFVSYADYPVGLIHSGNRDPMLDGACQGMATEARLVILSKMAITINGHPGREVSFEAQPGHPAGTISGRAHLRGRSAALSGLHRRAYGENDARDDQRFSQFFCIARSGPAAVGRGGSWPACRDCAAPGRSTRGCPIPHGVLFDPGSGDRDHRGGYVLVRLRRKRPTWRSRSARYRDRRARYRIDWRRPHPRL